MKCFERKISQCILPLRMGTQKTPLQKTLNKCQPGFFGHWFFRASRQFDWIKLSLVYDKSDKHTSIYDSFNKEMVSKRIKSVTFTNFTEIYGLTIKKKYDMDNLTQRHFLFKQFVAWSCNGSSVASLCA